MNLSAKIYIAGHRGLVGSALLRCLRERGYHNLLLRSHAELELRDQAAVSAFFAAERPDQVILAAAKVGGIHANHTYPAEFIHDNLVIQNNIIHSAWQHQVQRLLFLGSSCIYPKQAPQPMPEACLLTGPLEPTNRPYALAKIAGIEMCHAYNRQYGTRYMAVMPTNLYGPGDNYHLENSHVIPAMLRKFHLAKLARLGDLAAIRRDEANFGPIPAEIKEAIGLDPTASALTPHAAQAQVVIWGSGTPRREFLYSEDMAAACLYLLEQAEEKLADLFNPDSPPLVNIGCGEDLTIRALAELIAEVVGFPGELIFDPSKPDGTMRKVMDVSRLAQLGWRRRVLLREGLARAYQDMLERSSGR